MHRPSWPYNNPTMFIKCAETSKSDIYKILLGAVIPRPIGWISTVGKSGVHNLAPFSFFNAFGTDPPMVGFAPGFKEIIETESGLLRVPKDTMRNIEETGEFVVNIVTQELAEQMNASSGEFSSDISEFKETGLTPVASSLVAPPRVGESPINFECKLIQLIQHGNNNLVLGEVVAIHIEERLLNDKGYIDAGRLKAVGRLSGTWYCTTSDRFKLIRPVV